MPKLVIDTDLGVDDAAAIIWLLSQRNYPLEVLGFATVAGNTTLEHATNNPLTILEALGRTDLPVVMGAAAPLVQPLNRTGGALHGPDGFGGVGLRHPHSLSHLSTNVAQHYQTMAQIHPGAVLLTLGPLTNLALALEHTPTALQGYSQIVILGGAWRGGNMTPVAEFNIWQDARAAARVLNAGLPITLVTLDAFEQFTFDLHDVQLLRERGNPAAQLLSEAMIGYIQVQLADGRAGAAVPDVVAAMLAVDPTLGPARNALVRVEEDSHLTLGQTVLAFNPFHRVSMLLSPADLNRLFEQNPTPESLNTAFVDLLTHHPDNAQVITSIEAERMRLLFFGALLKPIVGELVTK